MSLSSMGSIFVMWGAGIRKGVVLERNVWLTDVTPTICYILDVPPPKDAEGAIIYQAFEDFYIDDSKIK